MGVAVHLSANGKRIPSTVENISRSGLFARTDDDVREGTQLRIDVVRPGWRQALTLGGWVVRRADWQVFQGRSVPGVGVQFNQLDEQLEARLQQALTELRTAGRVQTPPAAPASTLATSGVVPLPGRPPDPLSAEPGKLELYQRRCDALVAEGARREREVARIKLELEETRARLRALELWPGGRSRTDS